MRAIGAVVALALAAAPAHAEPWYRGPAGPHRVVNLAIFVGGGLAYVASETVLKPDLAAMTCRWCGVDSFDANARDLLRWHDTGAASALSNIDGFAVAPIAGVGLLLLGTASQPGGATWGRVLDDALPVLDTVVLSELVDQVVKFGVGRQRPYAHFNPTGVPGLDDNVSFFSGHSTLAFGIATSAGVIAHRRGYAIEPYVWGVGMTLAATTAYLRVAADEHYVTDVLTGSAFGVLAGLTVPWLLDRHPGVEVVPTGTGLAIAGSF
jgi:membrane-associated phospholipid phosphatase